MCPACRFGSLEYLLLQICAADRICVLVSQLRRVRRIFRAAMRVAACVARAELFDVAANRAAAPHRNQRTRSGAPWASSVPTVTERSPRRRAACRMRSATRARSGAVGRGRPGSSTRPSCSRTMSPPARLLRAAALGALLDPVVGHLAPADHVEPLAAREEVGRQVLAVVGRPEQPHRAGELGQPPAGRAHAAERGARRQLGDAVVPVEMQPDLMALAEDPADQIRMGEGVLGEHEEGGPGGVAAQHLENRGRHLRVRPVVEGEGDLAGGVAAHHAADEQQERAPERVGARLGLGGRRGALSKPRLDRQGRTEL